MVINQGDIYWIDLGLPVGSALGYRHPHVIIQNNLYNMSRISTVIVCQLTSNLRRAGVKSNVLLDPGEANLPQQSVVVVSQVTTVDKTQLDEYVGTLSTNRIRQILDGIKMITEPGEVQ